jgi:hypothetical protein
MFIIFIYNSISEKTEVATILLNYENDLISLRNTLNNNTERSKINCIRFLERYTHQIPKTSINISLNRYTHTLIYHEFIAFYMDFVLLLI